MTRPYEQREFTIGNIIGEALTLYRRFFGRFLSISLIVFLSVNLISAMSTVANSDTARGVWIILGTVASIVGFFGVQGALVLASDDVRDGRVDVSLRQLLQRSLDRLPYLVAAAIVIAVVATVAVVVLVLIGSAAGVGWLGVLLAAALVLFLVARLSVTTPLLVLENRGPLEAIQGSNRLVSGHTWRALWVIIVSGIMAGIASGIITAILSNALSGFVRLWLTTAISNALTTPFLALAWTLMYFHLRSPEGRESFPVGAAYTER